MVDKRGPLCSNLYWHFTANFGENVLGQVYSDIHLLQAVKSLKGEKAISNHKNIWAIVQQRMVDIKIGAISLLEGLVYWRK